MRAKIFVFRINSLDAGAKYVHDTHFIVPSCHQHTHNTFFSHLVVHAKRFIRSSNYLLIIICNALCWHNTVARKFANYAVLLDANGIFGIYNMYHRRMFAYRCCTGSCSPICRHWSYQTVSIKQYRWPTKKSPMCTTDWQNNHNDSQKNLFRKTIIRKYRFGHRTVW